MTACDLYWEATRRGLRLEPRGDKLAVIPAARLQPEFADVLRAHKRELLDLLEAKSTSLTPDCVPWLHVAVKSWPASSTARIVPPLKVSRSVCAAFAIRFASKPSPGCQRTP